MKYMKITKLMQFQSSNNFKEYLLQHDCHCDRAEEQGGEWSTHTEQLKNAL